MATALSEAVQAALLAWVPISPRLAITRLKRTTVNITVVAVYVPTLDAAEEAGNSFYDDLEDAVDRVPSGDMLMERKTRSRGHGNTAYHGQVFSTHEVR